MKQFFAEMEIEQNVCPVNDHRGCGLVERTYQTKKEDFG